MSAMDKIEIYNPYGENYINNGEKYFPITNSCERNAKLMGEDFIRLVFNLEEKVEFAAFSFIEYDGQVFFLKEQYIPTPNGTLKEVVDGVEVINTANYSYDVKFVSVANMLDKFICYRHVVVGDKSWDEPEININGTLDTLYVIVMGAIKQAAGRINQGWFFTSILYAIYNNGIKVYNGVQKPNTEKVKITADTKLLTFNFSGDNIANVCTTIANNFTNDNKKDTEWYISKADTSNYTDCTLHFTKCIDNSSLQVVSDYVNKNRGNDRYEKPYISGGLKKVEYAQAWSDIAQVIVPYGSERNMSYSSVKGIDEVTQMQSTFGKRLRLKPNNTYSVKDKDGNDATITTDNHGAIRNDFVNTGIEKVVFYDEIYPQCHFKVTQVTIKNKRQDGETVPEYTIEALPIDGNKEVLTDNGFYPIKIEEGTTLSVRFESGYLNGREFEIANKTHKDREEKTYSLKFTIIADGSIEDGTLIPSGNFIPHEGDEFALFNMKMPEVYITAAQQDLAQRAYNELVELQTTRPEVKCTSDPTNFNYSISFGSMFKVYSELFNSENTFESRVISYSYKLSTPQDVQFSLGSAVMQGTLSHMNDLIADVTNKAGGLEQRAVNLSRRGWRDASEVADMLDSMASEMMIVGNEQYQFAFTSQINCVNVQVGADKFIFNYLHIGYGTMQHTQEPYINYANNGWWEIGETNLSKDSNGNYLDADTAYYLYAYVDDTSAPAVMMLTSEDYAGDEPYLLLGILSSEFEGQRVFSRTNGYTAIEGGTITTEQIQDAGRNLIIDFQSNPPRIIARNGAEIIGNIKFKASDEKTAEEQLVELGLIAGDALSTAGDAKEKAENAIFIAESNKEVHNYYEGTDIVKNITAGTGYQSYWVKLLDVHAGYFQFIANEEVSPHLDDPFSASSIVICDLGAGIPIIDGSSSSSSIKHILSWGSNVDLTEPATIYVAFAQSDFLEYCYDYNDERVTYGSNAQWKISNIQVLASFQELLEEAIDKSEEAYVKAVATDYLREALTNGTTEIGGGIVMTTMLHLKNLQNFVTAGLSGLSKDNILLWGGATYDEAFYAAQHDEYRKSENGSPITTLIKKDGTGKIGIFKISDTQAIVDVPNQGKVVIDASSGNGGVFVKNTSGDIKAAVINGSISSHIPVDKQVSTITSKTFNINNTTSIQGSSGTCTTSTSGILWDNIVTTTYESGKTTKVILEFKDFQFKQQCYKLISGGKITIQVRIVPSNGNVGYMKEFTLSNITYTSSSFSSSNNGIAELTMQNFSLNTSVNGNFRVEVAVSGNSGVCLGNLYAGGTITCKTEVTTSYTPKTIIGTDGVIAAQGAETYFMVQNTSNGQKICARGLSNKKGDNGSGELYVSDSDNDGMVKQLINALNAISNALEKARYIGDNSDAQAAASQAIVNVVNELNKISIIANS